MANAPLRPIPPHIAALADEELVEYLYRALFRSLLVKLRAGNTSTEFLSVVRATLKDCGTGPQPTDDKKLRDLHKLFSKKLRAALDERPTAAVFSEVRHFLKDSGYIKELSAAMSESKALQALERASLPFKAPGRIQ